jgi:hypothetical protein
MSGGKLLMTETIKNSGWREQGNGDLLVFYFMPPTPETLGP